MVAEDSTLFSVVATGELSSFNAKATLIKFSGHIHTKKKKAGDTLGRKSQSGEGGEGDGGYENSPNTFHTCMTLSKIERVLIKKEVWPSY